jgi:ADP-heptose:LPS heptosyltransferase
MSSRPRNILIVRNDKLGDFVLALPAFALLKRHLPETTLTALVPHYTRDIAESCRAIDEVLIDPGEGHPLLRLGKLMGLIRKRRFDALITLYSTTRVALAGYFGGVAYRLAPATKLAQVFYNHRLVQRRSRSQKPEYAYNMDLAIAYLAALGIEAQAELTPPYLQFDEKRVQQHRQALLAGQSVDEQTRLVFVHPGSGGSARNLSLEQYAALCRKLQSAGGHLVVLSAGPGEREGIEALSGQLGDVQHLLYESTAGLRTFAEHLQMADVFISGSTGPLHIAGALDRPTVAFYPRRRSATALRWQTLNSPERRLAFSPPEDAEEEDMSRVDIDAAAQQINERFLK